MSHRIFTAHRISFVVLAVGMLLPFACKTLGAASTPPISRIAFLGDSITVGVGVSTYAANQENNPKRYSSVTTELLRAKNPHITEINMGASGHALIWGGKDYPNTVLAKNPDAVVIQYGICDYGWGSWRMSSG